MNLSKLFLPVMVISMGLMSFSSPTHSNMDDKPRGTPVDTVRFIFFLDGKRISGSSVLLMFHEKKVILKTAYTPSKTAVFLFGEQARNGILIFESNENNKEE